MNFTHDEKQRAFAAYRNVFTGNNSELKKGKKIKEVLVTHHSSTGQQLSDDEISRLVALIQSLTAKKVFRSTARAVEMFPAIFKPTVPRMEAREASEASASKKESEMLDAVDSSTEAEDSKEADTSDATLDNCLKASEELSNKTLLTSGAESVRDGRTIKQLSLFPTYLPYETQHLLLEGVQEILEQCCFEFVSQWLPEETQNRGWQVSSAVELTKWTRLIPNWQQKLATEAIAIDPDTSLRQTCSQVNKIRHAAVHRVPLIVNTLQDQLHAAIRLASTLKDETRSAALTEIGKNLEKGIQDLVREKTLIEYSFDQEMEEIRRQRRKLDEAELELYQSASRRDSSSKAEIGRDLCASTRKILSDLSPAAQNTRPDSGSIKEGVDGTPYWLALLELFGVRIF